MTGRRLRGRQIAEMMILAGLVPIALAAFLFVAAPSTMGGNAPRPLEMWTTWLGATGIIVGFTWMIRIYHADPEGHRSWWRFRRH